MATQPCPIASESLEDSSDPFRGSRYRCLYQVANGETGDTYIIEHIELRKRFAAKVLRAEFVAHPHVVDRMRLEAQSLGRLRHPNVVSITGFELTPAGIPFIVMELLRGCTLEAELCARGGLPIEEAIHWTKQLLSALIAIHEIGIVHRDLGPHNLILHVPKSGPRLLKVVDFSTARVVSGASERSPKPLAFPTAEGAIVGTPEFASPEAATSGHIDPRSDLYQAGLILYAMLTGRPPRFPPARGSDSRIALGTGSILPPSGFRSGFGADVDSIVTKALARNPQQRFQTAAEFRRALDCLSSVSRAPNATTPSSSESDPVRSDEIWGACSFHRAWVFVALSTAIAGAIFVVGLLISRWG